MPQLRLHERLLLSLARQTTTHAGIAAGRIFGRDGDLFGRTVNRAARIAGQAQAGQVLVDSRTVETWSGEAVAFEVIGDVALKGIADPVQLWRAVTAAGTTGVG